MKKYFVFIASFLSLVLLFSFSNPAITEAGTAEIGAECNPTLNLIDDLECAPDLTCDTTGTNARPKTLSLDNGTCIQNVKCTCDSLKEGIRGQGSFTCEGKPGSASCDPDLSCTNAVGQAYDVTKGGTVQNPFGNVAVIGVHCSENTGKSVCKCKTNLQDQQKRLQENPKSTLPFGGVNGIECTDPEFPDDPAKTQSTACSDRSLACISAEGQPVDLRKIEDDLFEGAAKVGVTCGAIPIECKCDKTKEEQVKGGVNGLNRFTCTGPDGTSEATTCSTEEQLCLSAPGKAVSRFNIEADILPGKNLVGIECSTLPGVTIAPVPPPPPPPCANGQLAADGTCGAFLTAFGEINTDPASFLTRIFAILLAISGGIALLLIIKAGYQLMVSTGNPEKVNAGRDQLIAAIVGLLFIIFSFVILQVIGVDILGIPGFGA